MNNIVKLREDSKFKLDTLFSAFSIIAEGCFVFLCDMKYDVSRWSKTAVDYFDLPAEYMEQAGLIWEDHIHPDDRKAYHDNIVSIFEGNNLGHNLQYRAAKRDGSYVVCECRGVVLNDLEGKPRYFGGAIRVRGDFKQIDTLTGLRNQYGFFVDLETVIRKRTKTNVLMFGIYKFSEINNIYGYEFGNRVLQRIGRFVQKIFEKKATVYRVDGARFTLITESLSVEELQKLFDYFSRKLRSGFLVDGRLVNLLIAAGLVRLESFGTTQDMIYSILNYAYQESKLHSHCGLVVFNTSNSADKHRSMEVLNTIRNSISRDCDGFYLCYQPVVEAKSERVIGAEALIRWHNSVYGEIGPNSFVPVLEQDNLFPELGLWILRQALTDALKIIRDDPYFRINVNISYAQVERADFVDHVLSIIDELGFPGKNLCLEITERCSLINIAMMQKMIAQLKCRGISFALDDFGTGFSSINILKKLDIDVVKVDREFVSKIDVDRKERETLRCITSLANIYATSVCVEGIESSTIRDVILEYGVDTLQGFFYSKPVTYNAFCSKYFPACSV